MEKGTPSKADMSEQFLRFGIIHADMSSLALRSYFVSKKFRSLHVHPEGELRSLAYDLEKLDELLEDAVQAAENIRDKYNRIGSEMHGTPSEKTSN